MSDPALEAGLRTLRETHQAQKARLQKLALTSRVMTAALALVVVGFLASLYVKASTMYAPEKFEAPVREEAERLLSKVEPELSAFWQETSPIYLDLAMQKFEQSLPTLQESARHELEQLRSDLTLDAEERVDAALSRIYTKHREKLAAEFPRLSTADGTEEMAQSWMVTIEADLEQLLIGFHERYGEDLGSMAATLEQFRPNRFEEMSEDELSRQFVHLWLMKVDRWVLLADAAEGGDHGVE